MAAVSATDTSVPVFYSRKVEMSDTANVQHPVFARVCKRIGAAAEKAGAAEHRTRLLTGLAGKVVEIRRGQGLNFK